MQNINKAQFKKIFLNVRWLIIISTAYMGVFAKGTIATIEYIHILIIFFILTNITLYFLPVHVIIKNSFKYLIFIFDITLVSLGMYITQNINTDFFYYISSL